MQLLDWNSLCNGSNQFARGHFLQNVCHFAFEMQSIIENDFCLFQLANITLGCLVQVGVNARAHEPGNLNICSAYLTCYVSDHARCSGYLQLAVVARLRIT
ncbi:hypothetical protein D3C74_425580 [compost metagenome]